MQKYAIRRILMAIPALVIVSLIIFSLVRLLPGDVLIIMLGDVGGVDEEDLQQFREQLGLERPFFKQYGLWVNELIRGGGGPSFQSGIPVGERFLDALPITIELMIMAMLLSALIGIPLGVLSAMRQNSWLDYTARLVSVAGLAMPNFWIGTLLLLGLSLQFQWIPPLTYVSFFSNPRDNLTQFIFPAAVLAFSFAAIVARMTRSELLEVMRQDYVRTAWAKGLRERVVVFRHALRNALIPLITVMGTLVAALISGTIIVESIFSLPGVGRLTLNAVSFRDYPQIQFNVMVIATAVITINLLVDLAYGWIDPRIRYE